MSYTLKKEGSFVDRKQVISCANNNKDFLFAYLVTVLN